MTLTRATRATRTTRPSTRTSTRASALLGTLALSCTTAEITTGAGTDVDATFAYPDAGLHSWPYFRSQLPQAWPTLARGLDV